MYSIIITSVGTVMMIEGIIQISHKHYQLLAHKSQQFMRNAVDTFQNNFDNDSDAYTSRKFDSVITKQCACMGALASKL